MFALKPGWRCRVLIHTWVIKSTSNEHFNWIWALFPYAGGLGRDHICKCVIHEGSLSLASTYPVLKWYDIEATSADKYFRPNLFFLLLCSICHIRFPLPWLHAWLWSHIMVHISQINTFSFKTIKELILLHCQNSCMPEAQNALDRISNAVKAKSLFLWVTQCLNRLGWNVEGELLNSGPSG